VEYAVVIETWLEADNAVAADTVARRLGERVLEHPSVRLVEVGHPERTDD
jgi:hypothetical protein